MNTVLAGRSATSPRVGLCGELTCIISYVATGARMRKRYHSDNISRLQPEQLCVEYLHFQFGSDSSSKQLQRNQASTSFCGFCSLQIVPCNQAASARCEPPAATSRSVSIQEDHSTASGQGECTSITGLHLAAYPGISAA